MHIEKTEIENKLIFKLKYLDFKIETNKYTESITESKQEIYSKKLPPNKTDKINMISK